MAYLVNDEPPAFEMRSDIRRIPRLCLSERVEIAVDVLPAVHLLHHIHAFPLLARSWEHGGLWKLRALLCNGSGSDATTLDTALEMVPMEFQL